MNTQLAIHVEDAYKSYGSKEVLKGLSMHVHRGHIYGLLGASGCGKTTLLSCVVGRKKLNAGQVWVLGGHPGSAESGVPGPRVGYMPQEIALVGEFTVRDAIFYFGRIFNMSDKEITGRYYKLAHLLDLPPADRYLKNCSGGQQRRVSFAAAMVHSPELLILDEPTVGLDPVLRDKIWEHLVEITKNEGISVIITTHYIEEARQSNVIGLMRDGKLLAEESPQRLLQVFQTDYLEDVFLILSQRQEQGQLNNLTISTSSTFVNNDSNSSTDISVASFDAGNQGSVEVLTPKIKKIQKKMYKRQILSGNRLRALLDKNWKQFYRNLGGLIFILVIPIAQILSFLLAVGADPKDTKLAIINDESMSAFCPDFTPNGTALPYGYNSCNFTNLACRFMHELDDPMIQKIEYGNLADAMEDIRHGKATGAMYIADNFTDSLQERIELWRKAEPDILDFSQIKVWLDMSNRQIGLSLKYRLYDLFQDFQKKVMADCQLNEDLVEFVKLSYINGESRDTFTIFMTPGVVLTIMFFVDAVMTSQIIIGERFEGIWERSTIAGVTSIEITLTHFIMQAAIVIVHTFEVLIVTFIVFNIENVGNIWTLTLLTYLQGIAGMSYGFWISIISVNYTMGNIVITGTFYFMIFLCGILWPMQGMPKILQFVGKCLPFTIPMESFRNVMKKGWPISDFQVWNGIGIELIWIFALGIICVFLLKAKR